MMINPYIQSLKTYVAGRSIEEVREKYGLSSIVKLGSNENPFGLSPMAKEAIESVVDKTFLYPDGGAQNLLSEISKYFQIPSENIMVGNGSDEILLMIGAAFLNSSCSVLVSENTFSQYACCSQILGAKIDYVPLKNFKYNLDGFVSAIKPDTKILYVCNPNNPTGTYVTEKELENCLKKLPQNCLLVLDEAYGDFATAPDFPNFQKLIKKHPRLIVVKTFSKLLGLAGLRLGMVFSSPDVIEALKKVKNFNPFNTNLYAQAAGAAVLKDTDFQKKTLSNNTEQLKILDKELKELGLDPLPSQANFICFQSKKPAAELAESMARKGVIIRALGSFSMPDWCRVTIGTPDENKMFLSALKESVK